MFNADILLNFKGINTKDERFRGITHCPETYIAKQVELYGGLQLP